jgi:hypothetical protein
MSPGQNLIDQVRDADPVPEAERLSPAEQREAEALLARLVAEPLEARTRPRRATLRRFAVASVGTACAVAVALGAIELIDKEAPGAGVVEKAVAAVSDEDAVYHIVALSRFPDEAPTETLREGTYAESWNARDGSMHRKLWQLQGDGKGPFLGELALSPRDADGRATTLQYDATTDTLTRGMVELDRNEQAPEIYPESDPAESLRRLQSEGRLRVDGTTEIDGKDAYRLVSGPLPGPEGHGQNSYEYLVDAETYYPLSLRFVSRVGDASFTANTRYLTYERLPQNEQTGEQLELDARPGN